MKLFYLLTRDLHLYAGLFISPFVIVFAVSVFCIGHGLLPAISRPLSRSVTGLHIRAAIDELRGKPQVEAIRTVLDEMAMQGEISCVRRIPAEGRLVVPVIVPGRETEVSIQIASGSATVTERANSVWNSVVFLHKMPGPHNVAIRGNWLYIRIWRALADATAYATLFITASGIYLWLALRAERRVGMALLGAGALSFFGVVFALAL